MSNHFMADHDQPISTTRASRSMATPLLQVAHSTVCNLPMRLTVTITCLVLTSAVFAGDPETPSEDSKDVATDVSQKTAWRFDFNDAAADSTANLYELAGGAVTEPVGPSSKLFVGLPETNSALVLDGKGARLRVPDDSKAGSLQFNQGDPLTIEAWVRPDRLANGANVYVLGKGRTYENGRLENQNYALRLCSVDGEARVSFLFATQSESDKASLYHRWTSDRGFIPDGNWHHVAIAYRFGSPASILGVIDGEKSKGKWDMAGSTKAAPIVDHDALWIGSSRGGDAGNSFAGALDDIVIHRELLPLEELQSRRQPLIKPPVFPSDIDPSLVTVTLHPGLSSHAVWPAQAPAAEHTFTTSQMAFHRLPMRYVAGGLRQPWRGPLLLRAYCKTNLPTGELTLLLRSPGLARLWVDGQLVVSTPAHALFPDAHMPFEVYQADHPWLHVPRPGDVEKRAQVALEAGEHEFILEQIVGAKGIRSETGDTTIALKRGDELFTLVGPVAFETPLSDVGFNDYKQQLEQQLAQMDRQMRQSTTAEENEFWNRRHALAREQLAKRAPLTIPDSTPGLGEQNAVDRFTNIQLGPVATDAAVDTLTSDNVFLRRLYLDTVGVVPTAAESREFMASTMSDKRSAAIDRLLRDDRWADHWTSYWQDVLAENPSILKPTLNNTGPFRWWIYDALIENKPMDRFVTELIRMEGDKLGGGAAGFEMASENDVPLAAKAHILTSAFLGVEMKCARCHDAPYHPWTQKELFGLAAMLANKPIKVPATSSVPKEFFERKQGESSLSLSIFPGDEVAPAWPFTDLSASEPDGEMLGRDNLSRERLAAHFTSAENMRFPEAIVNRLWQRVMGWGLVDQTGDWYEQSPRHPELLDYLARELVQSGYDFKHVARLIFNSRIYQRVALDGNTADAAVAHAAPWIRRLTAEQVVDSLHGVAGLPLGTEEITFDPSTQQHDDAFLNLGVARRAWQLTSLSNERDRPSLSLPKAAIVVECLEAFGWRGSRQEPVSHRETDANMVQPGVIANSALSVRLSRLSEHSHFTELALAAKSPEEFVQLSFEQVLSRAPTKDEMQTFVEQVRPGFDDRITSLALPTAQPEVHRGFVTWANHFDIRANQLMRDVEREVAAGPPPSARLKDEWRERAEDAVWALMNSPELQFVP